ncbi:MAG TPA: hypothetical protein VNQ80_15945 [Parapedobacter sp.]|uniref:hypothetical protein n=1 Tax=Parapedobacter sp. TaxID=1958893 RepID=UPI002B546707|nr:hypothetical protein [Parapedobacter sp.]HWK58837.1 hypothetical protein [Parapedobacter sp.]
MMNIPRYISFFLGLLALSCSKKEQPAEIADLVFPSDTYYVGAGSQTSLYIMQGNKRYQLLAGDETIIEAVADGTPWPAGQLTVKGLKKGSSVLSVTDEITGKEVSLTIHVVDPFLVSRLGHAVPAVKFDPLVPEATRKTIREEVKTFADFDLDDILVLHRNKEQRFFVFGKVDFEKGEKLSESALKQSGTYELVFSTDGEQQLTLHFDGEGNSLSLGVYANSAWAKNTLQEFSSGKQSSPAMAEKRMSAIHAETPIDYFDRHIKVFKDLTFHINAAYPDIEIESAALYQEVELWPDFQNYGLSLDDGILE